MYLKKGYLNVIKFLSFRVTNISNFPFQFAIMNGNLDILKFLVSQNLKLDNYNDFDVNYICIYGYISVVPFLAFQKFDFQKKITNHLDSQYKVIT